MNGVSAAKISPVSGERSRLAATLQSLAEFLVVGVCTVAFLYTSLSIVFGLTASNAAGTRDFVEYWASGQQLAHHANPYDAAAIVSIERAVGLPTNIPAMVMGNAPPALLMVLPLGYLSARVGEFVWTLLLLLSLIASVRMIWGMHGRPATMLHLLGYAFGPVLACVAAGQVSLFVLLGLTLFLRLRVSHPFLAGASLWLCALKPQLFLPFGVVLLAWIVATKSYKLLAGAVSALALSTGLVAMLDPAAWSQYRYMMAVARYDRIPIPCLSIVLRESISANTMWLQYLPSAIGCLWALVYFSKHRRDWDWQENGSVLMLVSLLCAPYTWLLDQAALLPALLHGVYATRSKAAIAALALASAAIEIAPLRGMALLHSAFYIWSAPAWLLWYLYATRKGPNLQPNPAV